MLIQGAIATFVAKSLVIPAGKNCYAERLEHIQGSVMGAAPILRPGKFSSSDLSELSLCRSLVFLLNDYSWMIGKQSRERSIHVENDLLGGCGICSNLCR